MITAPPLAQELPTSPPPGSLEVAVGLLLAQVAPLRRDLWAMLSAHLLGVGGARPMPAGVAAEAAGYTRSWLRDLLGQVRALALATGPPECVVYGARLLQDGPVRTLEQARAVLVDEGVSSTGVHPGALLRVAEVVGVACPTQLVEAGGVVLVAPHGHAELQRQVRSTATSACRRLDVASLTAVAAGAGVPTAALEVLLGSRWVVHHGPDGTRWCWRRTGSTAQRGLVGAVTVRLLAVRAYRPDELHHDLTQSLSRLPPTVRGDLDVAQVAPTHALVAWLDDTGLLEARPTEVTSDLEQRELRCPTEAGLRSDLVLAAAVRKAGRPLTTSQLAAALAAAGYAPSSATQLARYCPVLRRDARDQYALR